MCETELCATNTIPIYYTGVNPGTTILLKPKANITMPVEDKEKGTRLVPLKKRVHVVNYVVNYGVVRFTCLTSQEHLQHAWDITFQCPGELGYHSSTIYKHNPSMVFTQVHCSSTPTFYPGSKLPALLDHIICRILTSVSN